MNETVAANEARQSPSGDAALQAALAELRVSGEADDLRASETSAAAAREGAALPSKTVAQVLGEIAWLMTQSPRHRAIALGDLEWLVMPALLLRQFRIFYKGERPVGLALWALADDLVAKRIDAGGTRLAAADWKSGSHMRIIDI